MNIKFEKLTAIGQVWSIREMMDKGIIMDDLDLARAGLKHLYILKEDELRLSSQCATNGIDNIIEHAERMLQLKNIIQSGFDRDFNVVSLIWHTRGKFDRTKFKINTAINENNLYGLDFDKVNLDLQYIIKILNRICYSSKYKKITNSKEKNEINKMLDEVEDLKIKFNNKMMHIL